MKSTKFKMDSNFTKNIEYGTNHMKIYFNWYDYLFFTFMLVLSSLVGIYFGFFGKKQSTTKEYLLGDKQMKVFPISVSLVASHISGITLLAYPAEIYTYGIALILAPVAILIANLATVYIFLPVFFKLQITSTYEYLERRFDSKTRTFASFLFTLSVFFYLPIVIYIPALAFSAATGINVHFITPVVCGVCIFYTTIGGLKAVVWTDTIQFIVTLGSLTTVFFLGIKTVGGFGNVWNTSQKGGRFDIPLGLDITQRDSYLATIIGMGIAWIGNISVNQTCIQKFLSLPTLKDANRSVWYFTIGMTGVIMSSGLMGLIMYTKYSTCDPIAAKAIHKQDQLLPYFIMDVAGSIPGLPGLFIAGVFCAALSTLSATLNCLAGTIYEDFIVKLIKRPSEKTQTNILKLLVFLIGVVCALLVFVIEKFNGILTLAFTLGGITAGPLLGLFFQGVLLPKVNSKGAFYGSIIGLVFIAWVVFTAQYYKDHNIIVHPKKPTSLEGCINLKSLKTVTDSYNLSRIEINNNFTSLFPSTTAVNDGSFSGLINGISFLNGTTENKNFSENASENAPFFIFRISYCYYALLGCMTTIIFSTIIRYFTKRKNDLPASRDVLCPIIYFLLEKKEKESEEKENIPYYTVNTALEIIQKSDK